MGRAPCCEKMGLKKGPWTHEEDELLVAYIQQHGHGNWRALPKHAGLLRCGKSCRLRWTNYLRPDIKRGNFSREEEETIMKLHELLGNRWSAIAAKLPGRTDNEIKNVWHTHLKKKLKQPQPQVTPDIAPHLIKSEVKTEKEPNPYYGTVSPQPSSSEFSSGMESATTSDDPKVKEEYTNSWEALPRSDEHLWSSVMPRGDHFGSMEEMSTISTDPKVQFAVSSVGAKCERIDEGIDFWNDVDLFANTDELSELPEF